MRQSTMRWIAIAIVVAMIATVGIGLVSGGGGGDETAETTGDTARTRTTAGTEDAVREGPHLVLELCNGVTCPAPDDAAQQSLVAELDEDARVASTLLVSSEQAYQLFLDEWGDREDLVESVDAAEVPAFIELDLYEPEDAAEVQDTYAGHDVVAVVRDPGQTP